VEELQHIAATLADYEDAHPHYVALLFCTAYLFKQTFAIPGSVFLVRLRPAAGRYVDTHRSHTRQCLRPPGSPSRWQNLLAGSLYGWPGIPLVCLLNTAGATCCYLLAGVIGKDLVEWAIPARLQAFRAHIAQHAQSGLFFELVSLRILPITPHWLVNMASPLVQVPLSTFAASVLVGTSAVRNERPKRAAMLTATPRGWGR